jgi:hypothetical protein
MQWSRRPKAGLLIVGLSVAALFSAPDATRAATPETAALEQSDGSTNGVAFSPEVLQALPADRAGTISGILTKDPVLKLVHYLSLREGQTRSGAQGSVKVSHQG